MRNPFPVLALLFVCLLPLIAVAQVDLNNGLMAYYPFNGNADDVSGNNNNPVFNNATLTADYYGKVNSAYHFNGVDNYMRIQNTNSLNPPTTISICAWIKPTGFYTGKCHGNSVIMKGDADYKTGNYLLRFDDAIYTSNNNCNGGPPDTAHEIYYGVTIGLNSGQDTPYAKKDLWRSVVYTYDGTHSKLYIDCNLILDQIETGRTFSNAYDLFFGRLNDSQYPYWFNGDLDEVRIYNRAINADEVKAYSFSCAVKEPCSNWANLSGINPGIQIGDLDISGDQITVEALFNRTETFDPTFYGGDIVSKHTDPTDVNYLLRPTRAEITTTTGWHGTPDVCNFSLNKTYHVALVYDGQTLKFYRNGFLMSQTPCTGNMIQNNWITRIGSTAAPLDPNPTDFHGYVNEVRIWNVARSQKQIQQYINQTIPNPSTQSGLLAYYTFDDLKNKQGNSQWDGVLLNNAFINQTNPKCDLIIDSCEIKSNNVVANFDAPDSICINTPVKITNTSTNATSYYWSFCQADINKAPEGQNLGSINSALSVPVYSDIVLQNGSYYVFVVNNSPGGLTRLDFGNSLLNTPTSINLGNFGGVLETTAEGIQVVNTGNNWYGIIVGGSVSAGKNPQILKLDFGTDVTNTLPIVTNWGNIGNMNYPHELYVFNENNNWYGFTANYENNTITRFDFGIDFANTPTGTNLGTFNLLNGPTGLSAIKDNNNWYLFVTNGINNTITRLNFGTSLLNAPTAFDLGNLNGTMHKCWDISIQKYCDHLIGFVVNGDDNYNDIVRLDFNNDLLSVPAALSLGNIGNLSFPHSFSKQFRVGNDLYNFIPNAHNNTITRLQFSGCTNSSIPGTSQANPPAITYDSAGVYNINLTVDEGLPTQTTYCKQIIVQDCNNPCDSFKVDAGKNVSVCYGNSIQLNATGASTYNWNASTALSDTTIANPLATTLTTTSFIVTGKNSSGCSDTDTIKVTVLPLPVFSVNNDTSICRGNAVQLKTTATNNYNYRWSPPRYLSDTAIANPVSTPLDSIKYFVTAIDSFNCQAKDSVQINSVPPPVITTIANASICFGDSIVLLTTITNANSYKWSPPEGLVDASIISPAAAPAKSTRYIISAINSVCSTTDSVLITVFSLPDTYAGNDTTTCGDGVAQLKASGAATYNWQPSTGLSDTTVANPIAQPVITTTYYVLGTSNNGCKRYDSVTVTRVPDPVFAIDQSDSAICSGKQVSLTASGGDVYAWSPSSSVSNPTAASTTSHPQTLTNYSVYVYNSTCKVSAILNASVKVNTSPKVITSKSNDLDCANLQSQLIASGGVSYVWQPDTFINNNQIPNPQVSPPSDTWYAVTTTGSNGCTSTDSILVKSSIDKAGFLIAGGFTPNGDGLNDCIGVKYWGVPATFNMMIYDKWGMAVYTSRNIDECWDGSYKGKKQGSGTYVYMITATNVCNREKVFRKGTIVLIR